MSSNKKDLEFASLNFSSRSCQQASTSAAAPKSAHSSSSNAFRILTHCKLTSLGHSDNVKKPTSWHLSRRALAHRWVSGIGMGAGGTIIVRSHSPLSPCRLVAPNDHDMSFDVPALGLFCVVLRKAATLPHVQHGSTIAHNLACSSEVASCVDASMSTYLFCLLTSRNIRLTS
jgi:hypothetical protein